MLMQLPTRVLRILRALIAVVRIARSLGRDLYDLAVLEARLAAGTAAAVAALGAAMLALVATGWVLLVLALVAWIAERWMSPAGALLTVGLVMMIAALPLALAIRRLSSRFGFPETRRRIDEVVRG